METDYPFHLEPEHSINQWAIGLRRGPFISSVLVSPQSVIRFSDFVVSEPGESPERPDECVPQNNPDHFGTPFTHDGALTTGRVSG